MVKVGQPMAELDTDKLKATVESSRARLAAARARVTEAEATIREAKLDYERKKSLAARSVTSARDLEVAQAAYDRAVASRTSALADVDAARADLRLNETNLSKACICSPINGIVLKRNVEPGQTVATSFQAPVLFSIAEDLTKMEVRVDVDEADVGKVKEGQTASFTVDAYPDRKFDARIRELRFGSEVIQGVVTYKAVLTADNKDLLLRPGMTATAEIVVQHIEKALVVPNAALRFAPQTTNDQGASRSLLRTLLPGRPRFRAASKPADTGANRTLWILSDGKPQAVPVTVGATDGKITQIVKGEIEPGTGVILDSQSRAR
jgi:HlyD family secretion protein